MYARGHIRTLGQGRPPRSGPASRPVRRLARRTTGADAGCPTVRGGAHPSRAARAELDRGHGRRDRRGDRVRRVHRSVKGGDGGGKSSVAEGGSTPTARQDHTHPEDRQAQGTTQAGTVGQRHRGRSPRTRDRGQVSRRDGRSWVGSRTTTAGSSSDDLLKQGDSKTFQDSEKINLVLGDAGAIDLYVNGKKIEDDWQPGAVERLTYTKGDPQAG